MTPEEILQVEKDIVATLKNIYDPEIPVNIYDLGLIYEIDYTVNVILTFDPVWDKSMMSEEALLELNMF